MLHFKQNKSYIEQSKAILFENKKNDPAELAEISFCIKNVLGKNENLKTNDKIFSRYQKLSLSYILKLFSNFSTFQPQYSYKLYSYKKCVIVHVYTKSIELPSKGCWVKVFLDTNISIKTKKT